MLHTILPFHHNDEEIQVRKASRRQTAVIVVLALFAGIVGGAIGSVYLPELLRQTGVAPQTPLTFERTVRVVEESATVDVAKKSDPSVVSIIVTKDLPSFYRRTGPFLFPFDNFFDMPDGFRYQEGDGETRKQKVGGGTGFIISADGLLLTNRHVVEDEKAEYTVVTNNGKEYSARVLAKDQLNDLAIVKIDATGLTPLELGDSDGVRIGQTVIAIGNTLGEYQNTVTRGVVSGIHRLVQAVGGNGAREEIQEAIQTDAAINPGNSGGPLLNLAGQVIGINTAVNKAGQSIGFALPINVAKRSIESVQKHGRIIRPWLGVRHTIITEELQKANKLPVSYGALIQRDPQRPDSLAVIPGSPADKVGLKEGDIILSVNGTNITLEHSLAQTVGQSAPGDEITLKIHSKGSEKEVKVKLEEAKD